MTQVSRTLRGIGGSVSSEATAGSDCILRERRGVWCAAAARVGGLVRGTEGLKDVVGLFWQ